jgi:hypothetical protein
MQISYHQSYPLFLLFSALNRHGYDLEGNPSMHPLRLWVREEVQPLPQQAYFLPAAAGWPRANWLAGTALCLNDDLTWRVDPSRLWRDGGWECPLEIDTTARDWLWQLPEQLNRWAAHPAVTRVWPAYQERIRQAEHPELRDRIVTRVKQVVAASPFRPEHAIVICPNYLQSDWSADPVSIDRRMIILGPLSEKLARSVVHELVHEYFAPLLWPARESLGQFVGLLAPAAGRLQRWGYWHVSSPSKTVYKVLQECAVLAATALLLDSTPSPWWRERGLGWAHSLHRYFLEHGYFASTAELLGWLSEQPATSC